MAGVICLRMTLAWHSVVQGYLHCLTVQFHLHFSGDQVSRRVVANFLALLRTLDRLTDPVYSTAAQTRCHSIAPWGRAGSGPVLLLGTCHVEAHPSYEERNFSTEAIRSGSVSRSCVTAPSHRELNGSRDSGRPENVQTFVLGGCAL